MTIKAVVSTRLSLDSRPFQKGQPSNYRGHRLFENELQSNYRCHRLSQLNIQEWATDQLFWWQVIKTGIACDKDNCSVANSEKEWSWAVVVLLPENGTVPMADIQAMETVQFWGTITSTANDCCSVRHLISTVHQFDVGFI